MSDLILANHLVLVLAALSVIFSRQLGPTATLLFAGFVTGWCVQSLLCLWLR